MNRRSFLKGLFAIGAGFSILPPATTYERIWKVEKKVIVPQTTGVASIWQTHWINWVRADSDEAPKYIAPIGTLHKTSDGLWYRYAAGWVPLEEMTRPLPWQAKNHAPTPWLGSTSANVRCATCFYLPPEATNWEQKVEEAMANNPEDVKIPNTNAYLGADGSTIFVTHVS